MRPRIFMLLDFIEPGTDLREVIADLYAGSVVGYYNTDTREMFVLNDGEDPTHDTKYILAHGAHSRSPGPNLRPGRFSPRG